MKVFISWSGKRSKNIAEILRQWIPSVLQAVKPYYSPDDVEKGARWASEISKELEGSLVGLLIVTPENQDAPWLIFEAGALAKNLDRSKVCPLLFGGMQPTDVKGPLVQFQAAHFSKEEMKRVIKMVNLALADAALQTDVLEKVFEMWWPSLEKQIASVPEDEVSPSRQRSERDMIEEVLTRVRDFPMTKDIMQSARCSEAIDAMTPIFMELIDVLSMQPNNGNLYFAIGRLIPPFLYLGRHTRDTDPRAQSVLQSTWEKARIDFDPRPPTREEVNVGRDGD